MLNEKFLRILTIDLGNKEIKLTDREDLSEYLGGVGLAMRLFEENVHYDREPLDYEQPIIFAIGPLSTIFPVATKAVAVFPSPLTGELGESYAGMRLALAMRFAGYDAVLIKGKAVKPVYLSISNHQVEIKDAAALWGLSTE